MILRLKFMALIWNLNLMAARAAVRILNWNLYTQQSFAIFKKQRKNDKNKGGH